MKKIIFIAILIYTQLGAVNLDICNTNDYITICRDINNNIKKIHNQNKKVRLKAITQLGRLVGVLPSNKDSQTIKNILKREVKQYNSIFGGKFFEVLTQKCKNGKIYFVEAYFDIYYNVKFREQEYRKIMLDANNNLILDNNIYPIPNQSKNRYFTALRGKMHSMQQLSHSNLNTNINNRICLTGTLRIRSINRPYNAIAKVNENSFYMI